MYPRGFHASIKVRANKPLAVAVYKEIDCARRYHAGEIWTETLKVCSPAFSPGNRDEDLHSFTPMEESAAEERKCGRRRDAACGTGGGELVLVEVAL